ncbi:hypothetical protein GUJ93_ZPchr0001g31327 [Zizania palustris]|uniref:Uncharacterized protein n=1 Tax=Zizania palustris TaxID=103762 RepID=A0A8J5R573_ZIZPA|nr:hypothetical protein GUJ93_ZPchr0001g31327 [Zizania palustris]
MGVADWCPEHALAARCNAPILRPLASPHPRAPVPPAPLASRARPLGSHACPRALPHLLVSRASRPPRPPPRLPPYAPSGLAGAEATDNGHGGRLGPYISARGFDAEREGELRTQISDNRLTKLDGIKSGVSGFIGSVFVAKFRIQDFRGSMGAHLKISMF